MNPAHFAALPLLPASSQQVTPSLLSSCPADRTAAGKNHGRTATCSAGRQCSLFSPREAQVLIKPMIRLHDTLATSQSQSLRSNLGKVECKTR